MGRGFKSLPRYQFYVIKLDIYLETRSGGFFLFSARGSTGVHIWPKILPVHPFAARATIRGQRRYKNLSRVAPSIPKPDAPNCVPS